MATNIVMPQLGESVVEGTISKWFKQPGEKVEQFEPIMEVVTDKVTTEIPAPASGTLLQILVPEGTTVKAGTVVARIGEPEEAASVAASVTLATERPSETRASQAAVGTFRRSVPTPVISESKGSAARRFTPVVAKMIAEYNITEAELKTIKGTGENGRISKKDLLNFLKRRGAAPVAVAAAPPVPWEQPGTGELFRPTEEVLGKPPAPPSPPQVAVEEAIVPLSPIRRAIAEHMVRSKQTAPHVTTVHEADMSRVLAHFAKHQDEFARQGVKLTYTPYFVQAAAHALRQVPMVNAQFGAQGIVMKRAINIGIAVAIEEGLIVPVIKQADEKSLLGLARAVNDLAARAREKKLTPDDIVGGTFTITNYGVFGSLFGTPIIHQPQSAILGIGAIQKRVVVIGDAIAIRPMVYLALTFDHRLLDGAIGDTFMNKVKEFLENYADV